MEIKTQEQYELWMERVNELMKKGEANVSEEESNEIREKAVACEQWEIKVYGID